MTKTLAKSGPKAPWKWTPEAIGEMRDKLDKWRRGHTNFILAKFCDEHDVHPQLLSQLAQKDEQFSEALKRAKIHQEAVLFEGGLNGELNPAMAIFGLKNVANWRDRTDIGGGDIPIQVEVSIVSKSIKKIYDISLPAHASGE